MVAMPAKSSDSIPVEVKQQLLQGKFLAASKRLRELVKENNSDAKYQLAILFLKGKGVKQSVKKAVKLLKEVSKKQPEADFLLGSLYYKGRQLPQNISLAKTYLASAAALGNARARKLLDDIDAKEQSVDQIKPQTQRLFELAISSGSLSLAIKQSIKGANLNHPNRDGNTPLMTAMLFNRDNISDWLIKQKVDLKRKDPQGNTAFHIAAKLGKIKNIIMINKQIKAIDLINNDQQTALMLAIKNRQQATAQWLLNHGANFNRKDRYNHSAFDYNKIQKLKLKKTFAKVTSNQKQQLILQKNITHQINSLKLQSKEESSPYYKWPLLAIAVAQGQEPLAKALLKKGFSPWKKTSQNTTAVSLSVDNGQFVLLSMMLNKYPLKNQYDKKALEQLFFSCIKKDKIDLLKTVLKRAKEIGLTGLVDKGLLISVKEQNEKSVQLFLNLKNTMTNKNLLSTSITKNDYKTTALLIKKGLDVNWQDKQGRSALIIAAQKNNEKVTELLLKAKAKINLSDNQGLTALMWATQENCSSCVEILLQYSVDQNLTSLSGNNAVMFAAKKSNTILKLLLNEDEVDLSDRNKQSFTALMLAVSNNCKQCVKTLLKAGANPKRKNNKGQDSFDLALNNTEILSLLKQF